MKKPKKWKPEFEESYFFICLDEWNCAVDWAMHYEKNAPQYIFKTKREAEAVARKIRNILKESVK
jgi:hypothetical protein